jgi:hypothetical protein
MIKWNVIVKNSDYYVFGMEKSSVGYGIHKTNSISLSHICNIVNASNSNKQCTTPFFLNT